METFTFLFTDIEGSTQLLARLGEIHYAGILAGHHSLVRAGLAAHDGQEVDTQGDAFFAVFTSARDGVAAAAEIQRGIEAHAWPSGEQVRVRMGLHTGEATRAETGLVGLDVHRAARLASVGHGGQILLSEATAALVRDGLPDGTTLADLGVHRLKDLGRPERIYQLTVPGLPDDFPPLRSLGNPALPNNLPAQLATFVGRQRELAEVRTLTTGPERLVTLTGPGGAGKTRLALQVAAEMLDGSADGVWLVELAAVTDPDAVPAAITASLGITGGGGRPPLEALLSSLAFQNVLIILDNCEQLIDTCAKIADAILRRCPGVYLLATSREPLGIGGESIYRVPPMSLPGPDESAPESSDAVTLFLERAREQGVELTADENSGPLLALVCQRLDGLPLAIELAAARLRSMSLASLHDRLDQRFRLLTGGSRAALARQQTLRATVDWSYSLLSPPERTLLGQLSVFADGFDLDAVEQVCGDEPGEGADLLGLLVDKSLVVAERAGTEALRYRLLETIREFAAERLIDSGEDAAAAVAATHSAYFLRLAQALGPRSNGGNQHECLARLDLEAANIRRAVQYAVDDPDGTERALRFGVALRDYWNARHLGREVLDLLTPVLERPTARADLRLYTQAMVAVVSAAPFADLKYARRYGMESVRLARELGDEALLVDASSSLACARFFLGEHEEGFALAQESVDLARQLGADVLLGQSIMSWLLTADVVPGIETADMLAEAIAATERAGNGVMLGFLHNNASVHALRAGEVQAARAHLDQAFDGRKAPEELSDSEAINYGWVCREQGDQDGACAAMQAALHWARRAGATPGLAYAFLGLACLTSDAGDWDRAATLHGIGQSFADQAGEPWQPLEARYRQDSLDRVLDHLGPDTFDRAYKQGLGLRADDALRFAGAARPKAVS